MSLSPVAFIAPNYRDYKGWWLKFYSAGTTTPKTIILNSGGTTSSAAKLQLNKDGFITSSGGTIVVPYITGAYDAYLFPTAIEADANNTAQAVRVADGLTNELASSVVVFDNVAEMKAAALNIGQAAMCKRYYSDGELVDGLFYEIQASAAVDGFIDHALSNGNISKLLYSGVINVKQAGAVGDGVSDDTDNLNQCLSIGGVVECKNNDTYLISNEIQITVSGTIFDMKGSTIIAATSLPSVSNIVKIFGANGVTVKNGKINGNRANLLNTFSSGIYGNGLLVFDGCSNINIIDIETFECPTNGQLAVSLAGTISDIKFINYNSHDNNWTGVGGESQVTGNPIRYIQLINGATFGNQLGGDIRIQGILDFLIDGHLGIGGSHGAAVIGVGEAKNVTKGKIVNSILDNNNAGLPTLSADAMVGGSGVNAGQIETLELELDNVTLIGNNGNTGLIVKNSACVIGGTVTSEGHSVTLNANTEAIVSIDNLYSKNSTIQALDIDSIVELKNVTIENWGATSSACIFRTNSSGSEVSGAFGAVTGETGKDGVSQIGSPSNIRLTINSFTGSGTAKGLITGSVASTWEINELGAKNIIEIEDGIAAPVAEAGRAKLYIDVGDGNLKLLKGDGAVTVFDPIVTTTAELNDISSAINTDGRKTKGLYVHNDTTNKAVFANSSLANDVWLDAQGVTTHTPV